MTVKFEDFSFEVIAELDDTTIAWLHEWSAEIASYAQRNCAMDGALGTQLRGSYANVVDESDGTARTGTPLEAGFWEEFGTGEHADIGKNGGKPGRQGWWVYVEGQQTGTGGKTYDSQEEAEAIAASMRADGLDAHATNGRDPNYTLEKSYIANRPKAIADLETKLKELGK